MRFVIRADAHAKYGAGHVMRSSVIAEELIFRGFEVVFLGNTTEIDWVNEYVETLGFSQIVTSSSEFVAHPSSDVLILDSYEINPSFQFVQLENWSKVVVIVDNETPSFSGDLFIHAGSGTSWSPPIHSRRYDFFSGVEYILIRKSIRDIRTQIKHERRLRPRVLITGGGADPYKFSQEIYKILKSTQLDFDVKIAAPEFSIDVDDNRFQFLKMGRGYEDVFLKTDIVFTTAGTSSWEFIYLGLTTGIASAVPNQDSNYHFQIENSNVVGIGNRDSNGLWKLDAAIVFDLISSANLNISLDFCSVQNKIGKGFPLIIENITS